MSHPSNFHMERNQPLHYFTGRVRAFWKDLIFFSDARNVAVIEIHNVYINGEQASSGDLTYLEEMVGRSDWKGAPEFHSYVSEYPCNAPPPWPYQLSGKTLWKAKCAWFGLFPGNIGNIDNNNVVHMPISYYTGTIMELYNDKILFGDMRNSVMVTSDNFYVSGKRGLIKNIPGYSAKSPPVIIHAYIIRLEVLADIRLGGPEPDLPTWPKEHFSSDMWVAKYAWYGEMPEEVRDQIGRYYVIRLNQWGNIQSVPWKSGNGWQNPASKNSWKERSTPEYKQKGPEREAGAREPLIPTEQQPGFMRGSLLFADNKQGLMTSYVDVIAFSKDNFYVNGQQFRHSYDLDYFFQNRRVPLTAWVIPFDKPKVIFNINVVWYAVCVWYGSPPKDLENMKRKYVCEKLGDNLVETTAPISLTHFLGNVHSLSYASGVLMSKAGIDQAVKISFKRKVVYMYGSKFHSSCSLLDKQQLLESNIWSVLAYPVWTDEASGIPHYRAAVLWHYDDQHSMNMNDIISEFADLIPTLQNTKLDETKDHSRGKEKLVQHLSGCTVKVTEDYGIIQSGSALVDATYLYFRKEVLYIDGELFPKNACLKAIGPGNQCSMQAKRISPKNIDGHEVTMEATLVWIGRKPSFVSSGEFTPSDCSGSPVHMQITDSIDDKKPFVAKLETELCSRPGKALHAAEGVMVGSVFIVDKHDGLIICSDIIVAFSSDIFYVNGDKFKSRYGSLNEFCSDRKITVRALIATLKEPKVLLNCVVMCKAVCVWIGPEPNDLTILQKEHVPEKSEISDISKVSHKSLLYFKGRMTPVSKDVTLLASTTPEGTSKIIFSKENLYANGIAVQQDSSFEQCKRNSQNWSVLALPLPPRDVMGHTVCYKAVAVWDMSNHHKMRKVLKSLASQISESDDKQEYFTNEKQNGAGNVSKATTSTPEALLRTLKLDDSSKEKRLGQGKVSLQQKDPSGIVSYITKESSGGESDRASIDLEHNVSVKEFCGKHITGYIIKKLKGGGLAQWKSLQFKGYVFIEFSIESLYLDLEPVNGKWKVSDVSLRPCNLYVLPIPHHSVGEYTVSLKATCGWMGKKPSHLPSPGTQLFSKIDLSSVHVTCLDDTQHNELGIDEVEIPLKCYQNNNVNKAATSNGPLKSNSPQLFTVNNAKTKGSMIQNSQNGETSTLNCSTRNQVLPPLPSEHQNADKNKCEKIWEDKNRKKDHHRGTVFEVHSTVGQLKGVDGSLHYFSRENCYLYGVPLHNVELWHVLAQDDPVLYTVMELVPGMIKVQKVWLGALELPNNRSAASHILNWCQTKLVPDGARDILINQLEMQ